MKKQIMRGERKDIDMFTRTVLSFLFFDRCWETSTKRTTGNLHAL